MNRRDTVLALLALCAAPLASRAQQPRKVYRLTIAFALTISTSAVFPQQPPTQDPFNMPEKAEVKPAIESNPVIRPYVEVGDCWSYHSTSSVQKKDDWLNYYALCVTYVDYSKDVIFAVASSGGEGTDFTFTTEWNPVTTPDVIKRSGTHFLKFPLHVGDTHSFDEEYRLKQSPERERTTRWSMKVVGWEEVIVPAGTFRAVRIEGIGIGEGVRSRNQVTIWYVPEVNRYVKHISDTPSRRVVQELTSYHLRRY